MLSCRGSKRSFQTRLVRASIGNLTCWFAAISWSGSDGTRTRDLRRDRLVPSKRRLATMDALSLYSCCSTGFRRLICAQLRRLDFDRLLPFCCPRTRGEGSALDDHGRDWDSSPQKRGRSWDPQPELGRVGRRRPSRSTCRPD